MSRGGEAGLRAWKRLTIKDTKGHKGKSKTT
jgi:hypothetical protein